MSTIRVFLLGSFPDDAIRKALVRSFYSGGSTQNALTALEQGLYIEHAAPNTEKTGEDAAEEMFDLTNNPGREDERMKVYGTARSISVGDIVEVAGEKWLCRPVGWCKI